NERRKRSMAQMQAEQRVAILEDARLRAHRLCSAASNLLRSKQNERKRQRIAERRQQETGNQRQARLRV
ncbi:unnamed protein product, partial [Onchocerca ochengi]